MKRFLCLFIVIFVLSLSLVSCKNSPIELDSCEFTGESLLFDSGDANFFRMQPGEVIEGKLMFCIDGELNYTVRANICCNGGAFFSNMDRFHDKNGRSFSVSLDYHKQFRYGYNFEKRTWERLYKNSGLCPEGCKCQEQQ